MLEIRTAQLSSLRGPRRAQIFDSLQPLIERHFPTKSRVLGPEALRQAMEHGVERAIAHGLTTAHPVARFFGLMIVFGSELDTDPLLPWAARALVPAELPAATRVGRLYEAAGPELTALAGRGGTTYKRALVRARQVPFDRYRGDAADASGRAEALVHEVYPQRLDRLPPGGLEQLTARGEQITRDHALDPGAGPPVAALLVALLGYGIDRDPLHPWAGLALQQDAEDPLARTQALHRAALTTLQAYVDASEGAWD